MISPTPGIAAMTAHRQTVRQKPDHRANRFTHARLLSSISGNRLQLGLGLARGQQRDLVCRQTD